MIDQIEDVQGLLEHAVAIYQQGLACLETGSFDQLDDVMLRRQRVLSRLHELVAPGISVDRRTRECAHEVMQLEKDFIERVDETVIKIRAELVRTKRSQNDAHAYERAR